MGYGKYEYRCPTHGPFRDDHRSERIPCPDCLTWSVRVWGVNVTTPFQPHYNPTLGVGINSASQFQSELSRASEVASSPVTLYDTHGEPHIVERPQHTFTPVDARDKVAMGVTNDGLDATYDRWKSEGRDDDARKLKKLMDE